MLQVATKMYSTVEKTVTTSKIKVGSPGQSQTLGPIQQDKEYLTLVKYTKYKVFKELMFPQKLHWKENKWNLPSPWLKWRI